MSTPQTVDEFVAHITRTDSAGNRVFSNEAVQHVLPLIVMQTGFPPGTDAKIDLLMARFALAAGITEDMSPRAIAVATADYYLRHPVDQALIVEIRESAHAVLIADVDTEAARHVTRKVGAPTSAAVALAPPGRIERGRR